jgi:phosphatidylinositol alpha-1,6-mannosyltransferase
MSVRDTSGRKLRVLLVTRNYRPLLGGMEKFNERLFVEIARQCDAAIAGPAGCGEHVPAGCEWAEAGGSSMPVFLARLTRAALSLARKFRPDVVLAGSGLTAPIALIAARVCRARFAIFVYGLDIVVRSRIYQWLWMPAVRSADMVFPISEYTRREAISARLDPARMIIVTPGVDVPAAAPELGSEFRRRHGLEGKRVILSVGRLTRRKGIAEFVENALPKIAADCPDATLVLIGGEPSDALAGNRGGAMQEIRACADACGMADRVHLLGRCSDDVVRAALESADVHVFPVIELPGDVEGFGMVAIEAAACGVPTVAFRVGGIPDAVEDGISGRLVAPGDYRSMADAVVTYLVAADREAIRAGCIEHARRFDWQRIGERLVAALALTAAKAPR